MAKPIVILVTRDTCSPCYCGPARSLLGELINDNSCDGNEINVSNVPPNHPIFKFMRKYGSQHFPTFFIFHPKKNPLKDPCEEKIWGDTPEKWAQNIARQEIAVALDRVRRMR